MRAGARKSATRTLYMSVKWLLKQMQTGLIHDKYFEAAQKAANGLLFDAGVELNNNQLAISVAGAHSLQRGRARQS